MRFALHGLERRLANEIVLLPANIEVITEFERIDVIVLDILGNEASADRARGLVAIRAQPVAIILQHAVAGVNARQRRRDPARFERVGGIGPAAAAHEIDAGLFGCLEDAGQDVALVLIRSPYFETGRAGHAVTQRLYFLRADIDPVDMEELDIRDRPTIHLLEDLRGIRSLDLVAVVGAKHTLAFRPRRRPRIMLDTHIPLAIGSAEHQPARGRSAADEDELVLTLAENDVVTNDVTIRSYRNEMLGAVEIEIRKGVDAVIGKEFLRIGPFNDQFVHVVGLVKQHGTLAPCGLLGTPVAELTGDNRVYIHSDF